MISLQNSTNQKFSTSISSSNSRKWQSQTKLQGHATVTATVATQSLYITSALIVMEHQRTGTKATENPHTTQTPELSTKGLSRATSGGGGQGGGRQPRIEVLGKAEDDTHQDLCTTCTMIMKPTIAPKTALSTSTPSAKYFATITL
jgi:hypothetical protein